MVAGDQSLGDDVEVLLYAHSGTRIDHPRSTARPNVTPEVPTASPTIVSQINSVADPTHVDIALLNGGINDIDVRKIMNPAMTIEELSSTTESACYRSRVSNQPRPFADPRQTVLVVFAILAGSDVALARAVSEIHSKVGCRDG